jgi:hypothetical protein
MSDNRRVYRTIRKAILQMYPSQPKGITARMLTAGQWDCAVQELPIADHRPKSTRSGLSRQLGEALQPLDPE